MSANEKAMVTKEQNERHKKVSGGRARSRLKDSLISLAAAVVNFRILNDPCLLLRRFWMVCSNCPKTGNARTAGASKS